MYEKLTYICFYSQGPGVPRVGVCYSYSLARIRIEVEYLIAPNCEPIKINNKTQLLSH